MRPLRVHNIVGQCILLCQVVASITPYLLHKRVLISDCKSLSMRASALRRPLSWVLV